MDRGARLRLASICGLVVVITGPWWATGAQGETNLPSTTVSCGTPIYESLRVANNLKDCPGHGLVILNANVTVDLGGHRIDGTGGSGDIGIDVGGFPGVTVRNGTVTDFQTGVRLGSASGATLVGLNVHFNTGDGIVLSSADDNTVKGNTVLHNTLNGVMLSGSSNNILKGNTVSANGRIGILLGTSSGTNRLVENVVAANGFSGPTCCWSGIDISSSSGNILRLNKASGNAAWGIALTSVSSHKLIENEASDNYTADGIVLFTGSSNNVLKGNRARRNGFRGIHLTGGSNDNTLKRNVASANQGVGIEIVASTGATLTENRVHENGSHGIASNTASLTLTANKANGNGYLNGAGGDEFGLGISVPAGTTNAQNSAKRNDDSNQCEAPDVNCHVP